MKAQKSTKISFPDVVVQLHLRTKHDTHDVTESDRTTKEVCIRAGNKSREECVVSNRVWLI